MAFVFFLRRSFLPFMVSTALVACSSSGLVPPDSIDGNARVGAIAPVREQTRQRRVQPMQPSDDISSLNNDAGSNGGDLAPVSDTLVGETPPATRSLRPPAKRLPMIDSDEAMATAGNAGPATSIPEEGVNMDAQLGVDPVVGLAQEENLNIAEGSDAGSVVDGIGTDNPTQVGRQRHAARQSDIPEQSQLIGDDQSNLDVPGDTGRSRNRAGNDQVAFLPRAANPMTLTDESAAIPASELACRAELKRMGVSFDPQPPVSNGPTCGIPYPIKVSGLAGGVRVSPAVTLNCQVTLAFTKWVRNELVPAARLRYFSGVKTVIPLGGYSCRRMNSGSNNPWSEHAHGNAIDVGKFVLNSGREIDVRKPGFFSFREKGLLKAVRTDSCNYFNTVLGPGDPHHKDHFHFDLRDRHGGRRYCH